MSENIANSIASVLPMTSEQAAKAAPQIGRSLSALCRMAQASRSVNPAGAALIFGAGLVAGAAGSLTVALVALALLAGLHLANRINKPAAVSAVAEPVVSHAADLLDQYGLVVKDIKLSKPAGTNGRARKTA